MRRQLLSPSPSNLIWWELLAGLKPSLPAQTLSGLPQLQLCVVHKPIPHHFTLLSTHHLLPNVPYNNLTFIESTPGSSEDLALSQNPHDSSGVTSAIMILISLVLDKCTQAEGS